MADVKTDVYQILADLRKRALGINDSTKPLEGFMVSFLPTGRPVHKDDYGNPWTPDLTLAEPKTDGSETKPADGTPDPALLNQITKRQRNLGNISRLVDHKLQLNAAGQEVPGSSRISETWKVIVDGANAVPLPPINDPNLKKALDKAMKLLMKQDPDEADNPDALIPTSAYEKYQRYRKAYNKSVQAYTAQYLAAAASPITLQMWPVTGKTYLSDVDSAMDEWISLGKKIEIENAIDLLAAQGTDSATKMIAMAKKNYEKYQVSFGALTATVPFVQLFPTNWCDPVKEDDGWTQYEYDSTKSHSKLTSEETSFGGSAGVNLGFFSIGASAEHSESKDHSEFSNDGLHIKFRYAIIDIERPWLNTVLLNMGNWFLNGFPKNAVSNGQINQQKPLENEAFWLPSIPTQLIVLKDLHIKTNHSEGQFDAMRKQTKAGGSFGWGPFTIGGHYGKSESQQTFDFSADGEGLHVEGVQIIGWISQVLPAAPKVNAPNMPVPDKDKKKVEDGVHA